MRSDSPISRMILLMLLLGTTAATDMRDIKYTVIDESTIYVAGTLSQTFTGVSYRYGITIGTNPEVPYDTNNDLVVILTLNSPLASLYQVSGVTVSAASALGSKLTKAQATLLESQKSLPVKARHSISSVEVPPSGKTVKITWNDVASDSGYTIIKYVVKWTSATAGSLLQSSNLINVWSKSFDLPVDRPVSGQTNYFVTVSATWRQTSSSIANDIPWSPVVRFTVGAEADLSTLNVTPLDHQTVFVQAALRSGLAPTNLKYVYRVKTGASLAVDTAYECTFVTCILKLNPGIGNAVRSPFQLYGLSQSGGTLGNPNSLPSDVLLESQLVWDLSVAYKINAIVVPDTGDKVTVTWETPNPDKYTFQILHIRWTSGQANSQLQTFDSTDRSLKSYSIPVTRPTASPNVVNYYVTMGATWLLDKTRKKIPWSQVVTVSLPAQADLVSLDVTLLDDRTLLLQGTLRSDIENSASLKFTYGVKTGQDLSSDVPYKGLRAVTVLSVNPRIGNSVGSSYQIYGFIEKTATSSAAITGSVKRLAAAKITEANLVWDVTARPVINRPATVSTIGSSVTISWQPIFVDSGFSMTRFRVLWVAGTSGSKTQQADITDVNTISYTFSVTRPDTDVIYYYVLMTAIWRSSSTLVTKNIPWSEVITVPVPALVPVPVPATTTKTSSADARLASASFYFSLVASILSLIWPFL